MPGSNLSLLQKLFLLIALLSLGLLMLQNHPTQATLSGWRTRSSEPAIQSMGISGAAQPLTGRGLPGGDPNRPLGNPLRSPRTIMTQGYGVGSHAPADVWGALDLAIDGNGDGIADPDATNGAPIYATHAGTARVKPNTWPAGNYLAIEGVSYKTAFAHLSRYAVADGQHVERGDLVGYVGATGEASGPHLHYEVWKDGLNVNPLDYGVLDGVTKR